MAASPGQLPAPLCDGGRRTASAAAGGRAVRRGRIDAAAVLTGTIVDVRIKATSTRAIVSSRPDKTTQDRELEEIRTERSDTPEGAAMIARARAMIGHRAVFYKYNEKVESAGAAARSHRRPQCPLTGRGGAGGG